MAAVQAFQHNCTGRHVCESCGKPIALSKDETYFSALGVPEKFAQDQALLQKRFYEVSRALHPDRFTTADADSKRISLERMSFVNEAYRTLKSPSELRGYVLTLHGLKSESGPKGRIPMELAESWFELQDALAEDSSQAQGKIAAFRQELAEFRAASEGGIKEIEAGLDTQDPRDPAYRDGLQRLAHAVHELGYLESLARDVERMAHRG